MKQLFCLLFALVSFQVFAQNLPQATPESVGMSSARLKRIDAVFNEYIQKGWIPGGVTLIIRDGKIVHYQAYGFDDTDTKKPLSKDGIFRLASQTKAITSTAVMMLYEEGKFLLDDPISKYLPAFKSPRVLDKFNESDTSFTSIPAKREITIRDLLSHTSGIGYPTIGSKEANAIYAKYQVPGGIGTPHAKLGEVVNNLAKLPLMHSPGERWTYGLNLEVLGHLVETLSGLPLEDFFQTRIFKPLGISDTYFYLPESKFERLIQVYTENEQQQTTKAPTLYQDYPKIKGGFYAGGAGLSGTTLDYAKFLQMFLNGGSFNGQQILSPAIVKMMTSNQIGDLSLGPRKFGLGFALATPKEAARIPVSEGSFEWGGIFGTNYWVDPKQGIIGLCMTQKYPNSHPELSEKFKVLVYQAITKLK
jgi:CubicO group peptidase (beta-lactamase class C family)